MFKTAANFGGFWIKSLKFYPGHEGENCAYGSLYRDGKRIGDFREDGWGGPMQVNIPDNADQKALDNYASSLPKWETSTGTMLPMDAELVISEIAEAVERVNYFKRKTRKQTLFTVDGDGPETYRTLKAPYEGNEKAIKAHLDKTYGAGKYKIYNEELRKAGY